MFPKQHGTLERDKPGDVIMPHKCHVTQPARDPYHIL